MATGRNGPFPGCRSDAMRFLVRHGRGFAMAAGGVLVAIRLAQAGGGAIPTIRAAAEIGLLGALVAVGAAASRLLAHAGRRLQILVAVALAAWGTAVAMPLVYAAHPPRGLYAAGLGGPFPDVPFAPATRT